MKTLKALLLSFVFVLSTSLCYAEMGLKFDYFSGCAYKTGGKWEAFLLTTVVNENGQPVPDATIIATWDNEDIEICHTDNKGRCKFHNEGLGEDYSIIIIDSVEKEGYLFKDQNNTSMMIMRP